jgi:hypothetical protein
MDFNGVVTDVGNVLTVTKSSLTTGQTYTARVRAVAALWKGGWSNLLSTVAAVPYNAATGGTVTDVPNYNGTGETWRVHEFGPGAASLVVTRATYQFKYLLTGGGGGGAEGGASPTPGMPGGGADVSKGLITLAPGPYSGTIGAGAPATTGGYGSGGAGSTWNGISVAGGPASNPVSGHNGANAGADDITGRAGLQYGVQGDYKGYNNKPGAGNGGGGGRSPGEWGYGGSPGALIIAYRIG